MKEILDSFAAYVPRFLNELMGIFSGPKSFFRQLDINASDSLTNALIFYVLCLGLSFFLELPFITTAKELWIMFVVTLILFTIGSLLIAATYKISFRVVGGKGTFYKHFLLTLYVSGPAYIIFAFIAAASKGIVLSGAPDLYPLFKQFMDTSMSSAGSPDIDEFGILFESIPTLTAIILGQLIWIVMIVWIVICWGAYRYINDISKFRSVMAFIVLCVLQTPVYYLLIYAQRGLGVNLF